MGNKVSAPKYTEYTDLSTEDKQLYEDAYVAKLKEILNKSEFALGFELQLNRLNGKHNLFYTPPWKGILEHPVYEPLSNILTRLKTTLPMPYTIDVSTNNTFYCILNIRFVQNGVCMPKSLA